MGQEVLLEGLEAKEGLRRVGVLSALDAIDDSLEMENKAYQKDLDAGGKEIPGWDQGLAESESEDMSKQLAARDNITTVNNYYGKDTTADTEKAATSESEKPEPESTKSEPVKPEVVDRVVEKVVEKIVPKVVEVTKPLGGKVMAGLGAAAIGLPAMGFGLGFGSGHVSSPDPIVVEKPVASTPARTGTYVLEAVPPNGAVE